MAVNEDGTRNTDFDLFDNDYIEVFAAFNDYDKSQREGKVPLY